ncbi:hypothetical protein GQ55_7G278000 [Panicum hallii var. hallii]|uniref:F-box/LRR-repeat protein 15/At3g58940/PEG3-like LRR domain-containing protein n=1 Tax=Panicum hallii var. hallii TaxID=1504633 RepID=A0A2T7CZT9_9POAL|nr:hypothetical protein GQ55_7G278000 [Panicum hallii var. hallii]
MGAPWALRADAVTLALASQAPTRASSSVSASPAPPSAPALPLVLGFRDFFHGIDKPAAQKKVSNGLRALFNSVKILAISVTFSSKNNMESVMNLLKCFPFLETLHILGNKRREGEVHTIGPNN